MRWRRARARSAASAAVAAVAARVAVAAILVVVAVAAAFSPMSFAQKRGEAAVAGKVAVATVSYEVKAGDTLERLAATVYGGAKYAPFIAAANGIATPRALVPGERLNLSVERELVVSVGDTLASIAAEHLGSAMRATFLATANRLAPGEALTAGTLMRVPVQVAYTAAGGETLAALAVRFYGDATGGLLLREYNGLGRDQLAAGDLVLIPGFDIVVDARYKIGVDEEGRRRLSRRVEMEGLASKAVPRALEAWREGNMAHVKRELVALDMDYLAPPLALDVALLLGGAYIANGDADSASAVFRRILARTPGAAISAYHYPSKICAVWRDAGGIILDQQ